KANVARGTCFVEAEVEALAVVQRENVVKERIFVRKLDDGAGRNDEHVRLEGLVALEELWNGLSARDARRLFSARVVDGYEPDSDARRIRGRFCFLARSGSRREFDLDRDWRRRGILLRAKRTHCEASRNNRNGTRNS